MASADRKKAIEATRENGVVVAGAGTGKTTLLTERVLRLILHDGIPVQKIACLTFTEKAAGEMRERISKALLEARSKELEAASAALEHLSASQIDTIHGFCAHLLRLYPLEAGVDPAFKIDQGENWQTLFEERYNAWLSEELGEYSAHETEWLELLRTVELKEIRELAEAITRFHVPIEKLNPSPLNPPLTLALSLKGRGDSSLLFLLSRLVPFAYQFRKSFLELGYVSFDALLVLARNLVRDHWRIREELKVRYPAILVDEFQDTDPLQAELLLYLAEEIDGGAKHWSEVKPGPGRLFIVGDPKQ